MTYPAWPSCLPIPQLSGYEFAVADSINARDTSGPVLARSRMTRQSSIVAVSLVMTSLQLAIWEAWYKHIIHEGASWFTLTLEGETFTTTTARLVGGYAPSLNGQAWSVSLSLLVDDPQRGA